jgi:hypothetical protein
MRPKYYRDIDSAATIGLLISESTTTCKNLDLSIRLSSLDLLSRPQPTSNTEGTGAKLIARVCNLSYTQQGLHVRHVRRQTHPDYSCAEPCFCL